MFRCFLCLKWRQIFSVRAHDFLDWLKQIVSANLLNIIQLQTCHLLGLRKWGYGVCWRLLYAPTIKFELQIICNRGISISMTTASLSLFGVLICKSTTTKNDLKINLKPVHESYRKIEMTDVAIILSENNIADSPKKIKSHPALNTVFRPQTCLLDHPIQR